MNNSQNQLKKLQTRLWAGIFLVFIMLLSGALFLYGLHVKALFGDYTNKGLGDTLTADEWNDLDRDFVNIPVGGCFDGQVLQSLAGNWICADAGGGLGPPDFDSGWNNLPRDSTIVVNLNNLSPNPQNFLVDMSGSEDSNGLNPHIYAFGGETSDSLSGWVSQGVHWYDLTANSISIHRQFNIEGRLAGTKNWDYVRIRIWDTSP